MQKVVAAVRVSHTPNTEAVIRAISMQPSIQQRLHAYAKSCVQEAHEYFQHQLDSSLKVPLSAFKAAQILFYISIHYELSLLLKSELERLKAELPTCMQKLME